MAGSFVMFLTAILENRKERKYEIQTFEEQQRAWACAANPGIGFAGSN
jgi:hypothetical protein